VETGTHAVCRQWQARTPSMVRGAPAPRASDMHLLGADGAALLCKARRRALSVVGKARSTRASMSDAVNPAPAWPGKGPEIRSIRPDASGLHHTQVARPSATGATSSTLASPRRPAKGC